LAAVSELLGRRVYPDANIFIYAVEDFEPLREPVVPLFEAIDQERIEAVTSELTLAEVLVKPLQRGADDVAAIYREMLRTGGSLRVVPVRRTILIEAAGLRASLGMKLPDAIHVATARNSACADFLTNDDRLALPNGLALAKLA
jgi:predicted nucleic acid-binding protein